MKSEYDAFRTVCEQNSGSDPLWAIAYAILLHGEKTAGTRISTSVGEDTFDDLGDRISTWIEENGIKEFCLLDVWVEALGNDAGEYDRSNARLLGRLMNSRNDFLDVGVRKSKNYGNQRRYMVLERPNSSTDDLGI